MSDPFDVKIETILNCQKDPTIEFFSVEQKNILDRRLTGFVHPCWHMDVPEGEDSIRKGDEL